MSTKFIRGLIGLTAAALAVVVAIHVIGLSPSTDYGTSLYDEENLPADVELVVFLGNSHTYGHEVPQMVEHIAASDDRHPPLWAKMAAGGGWRIQDHLESGNSQRLVRRPDSAYVVIQGASGEPLLTPDQYRRDFTELADQASSEGAEVIAYQTWPYAPGHQFYTQGSETTLTSPAEAFQQIEAVTGELVRQDDQISGLAPVGRAFEGLRNSRHDLDLYADDGNHATVSGAYLAALVIYTAIRDDELPDAPWHPSSVSEQEATVLQQFANRTHRF